MNAVPVIWWRQNFWPIIQFLWALPIYISDLPETTSRKYGYADDLAILLRRPSWKEMEEGLNTDMTILVDYFRK